MLFLLFAEPLPKPVPRSRAYVEVPPPRIQKPHDPWALAGVVFGGKKPLAAIQREQQSLEAPLPEPKGQSKTRELATSSRDLAAPANPLFRPVDGGIRSKQECMAAPCKVSGNVIRDDASTP